VAIPASGKSMSHSLTAHFPPLAILATVRSDSALSIGDWSHYRQQKGSQNWGHPGAKKTELMGLGPKWGHEKSYGKLRLAVGY